MSDATIQVRLDSKMKENAEEVFAAMGLKISEAIRMFLQQTITDEALPFQPSVNKLNKATIQAFKEVKSGKFSDSNLKDFKKSLKHTTKNKHEKNKTGKQF